MAKALFYKLFGIGKIPVEYLSQLQAEDIVLLDEGIKGSVTYRNFHRPGKYANWQRRGFIGSIALTKLRWFALNGVSPIINIPLTDERIHQMRISAEKAETLLVTFDADLFQPEWSGTVEYRFRTPETQRFLDLLPK